MSKQPQRDQNWWEVDALSKQGLIEINSIIATWLGYEVLPYSGRYIARRYLKDQHKQEIIELPDYCDDRHKAMRLPTPGYIVFTERVEGTVIGHIVEEMNPQNAYEYTVSDWQPEGLASCLAWLLWYDDHNSDHFLMQWLHASSQHASPQAGEGAE